MPPETEELKNNRDLQSSIEQCFYLCKPGFKKEVIFNLDMLCRSWPEFDAGEDILGWVYYFDTKPVLARQFWSEESDEYHLDIAAGMLFLAADSLNSTEVIRLGQQIIGEAPQWYLGKEVFQRYSPIYGFHEYISVNHVDIRVLMAEAYYVEGNLTQALAMLKSIDNTLMISDNDPRLAHILLDLISEYMQEYVLSFN